MNIPVLNESPRPAGSTAGMINVFKSAAEAAGHSVMVYAAFLCILLAVALVLSGCTSGSVSPFSFVDRTNAPEDTGSPGDFAESIDLSSEKNDQTADHADRAEPGTAEGDQPMIYAHVNGKALKILAAENSSADAFLDLLKAGDVTVDMHDYGSFEKVGSLGTSLPRNDEQITTEPGDVILYQGDQITIYYDVNSWSFTRLGKVQDLSQAELKEILGDGNVTITFSLRDEASSSQVFNFESRTVLLNSGYEMPIIGLGTWTLSDDEAENSVYHALKSGMRLIDTAR